MPLMKAPDHFHRSPLLGAPARNRTWLAFHRGRVRAPQRRRGGGPQAWGAPPPPMSLSKAPPCARHHLLFLCLPRLPFFFPPSFPSSSSLLLYPAGPAGQPALLARHPPAPLQRLARRRLAAQARHRDQRGVGGVGRRGGLGWAGLTVPPALTGVQPGGAPYPTHTSASIQPPPPPAPLALHIHTRRPEDLPGDYSELLAASIFCLVLPGDGWSARMDDATLHGCIPVIIMVRCTALCCTVHAVLHAVVRFPAARWHECAGWAAAPPCAPARRCARPPRTHLSASASHPVPYRVGQC